MLEPVALPEYFRVLPQPCVLHAPTGGGLDTEDEYVFCEHYTKLEYKISGDTSDVCDYGSEPPRSADRPSQRPAEQPSPVRAMRRPGFFGFIGRGRTQPRCRSTLSIDGADRRVAIMTLSCRRSPTSTSTSVSKKSD